jgi:hypothetical protein
MREPISMLYLGSQSQISEGVELLCRDHFSVSSLVIEEDQCCDASLLEDVKVVMVNLMFPWDLSRVINEASKMKLPVVGVHTFNNEAVINNYISKGLYKYISLFDLDDSLEVLSEELKKVKL